MSVLSADTQTKVEDALIEGGILSADDIEKLKQDAKSEGQPFFGYLISGKHVEDEALTRIIAHINNVPYVNLSKARIDPHVLILLPEDIAERYMAVPLGEMQHRLVVGMLEADNVQAVDFLSNRIGRPLKVYAASEGGIRQVLKQYSAALPSAMASELGKFSQAFEQQVTEDQNQNAAKKPQDNIKTIVQDSPISKALSTILEFAAQNRASDVHIEPLESSLKIRCRIDGVLREIMKLPKSTEPALVSRIKILANLKIDEHRIPQDGGFTILVGKNPIDLRIAISPVIWGEQVVIRLLDKSGTSLKLEAMGYAGRALRSIRDGIKQSNGMVLTSGPTGSGKSTSLYALLQEVKNDAINIVTLEDPVEYKMDGINQIQVNPEVGLPRLLDMEVEPFLIASTVRTVIGQRLVRRIGPEQETYQSNPVDTQSIKDTIGKYLPATEADRQKVGEDIGFENLPLRGQNAYTLTRGIDSTDTPAGYKGRIGIFEVFSVTEEIQELILKRATSEAIQEAAQKHGMISMREDGYLKALNGLTTINEVNRVATADSA